MRLQDLKKIWRDPWFFKDHSPPLVLKENFYADVKVQVPGSPIFLILNRIHSLRVEGMILLM